MEGEVMKARLRDLLILATIAFLTLASCGGDSGSGTASYTLRGAVIASKVKGAKVCEAGTDNCAVTDSNGYYTLTVHTLPVTLEVRVGKLILGDVQVQSANDPEETVITPLDLAEGDQRVAEKLGAFIHALAGDYEGDDQTVDLGSVGVNIEEEVHVEEKVKHGEVVEVPVGGGKTVKIENQGVEVQEGNNHHSVNYDISAVENEEEEVCQQLSHHEETSHEQQAGQEQGGSEQTGQEEGGEQQAGQEQGGSEQTGQEERITIRGLAYDSEVESGTAYLYKVKEDGNLEEIAQTDFTNGEFSFDLPQDEFQSDAKYVLKVEGRIGDKEVKFVSALGSGETIVSKAQENNGEVSQDNIPELVVSNVSTADYLLLKSEYGNIGEIDADELEKILADIKALKLDERLHISAAIKAYVDKGAELKEGINGLAGLVKTVITKVRDDGKLTTSELKEIFANEEGIEKFGEALTEVKKDEHLEKVLVESVASPGDEDVRNEIEGKTFYFKPDEYAPVYTKLTFKQDGTIESHTYVFEFDGQEGNWREESAAEKAPVLLRRWEVSNGNIYLSTDANMKYSFHVLSVDDDKVTGIATLEDTSNINWLSEKYAMIHGSSSDTYQNIQEFVNSFTNCDLRGIIQAYMNNNFQQAQELESHCFLRAFEFDTQNHKVVFLYPVFDVMGNLTDVKRIVYGDYEIQNDILKVTFHPVKFDDLEYQIFPENFSPIFFVKIVDEELAQQAQQESAVLWPMRSSRQHEETPEVGGEEGVPPEGETQPSESEGEGGEMWGASSVHPQVGNAIVVFAADNIKLTLYKREELAQSLMSNPFALYGIQGPPSGEDGEGGPQQEENVNMNDVFETHVCRDYVGEQEWTLQDSTQENSAVTVWCENDELKIRFNGQTVDYDEDTGKLTSCPFFENSNSCTVVDATEFEVVICKLNGNGEPDDCKAFVDPDKLDRLFVDIEE